MMYKMIQVARYNAWQLAFEEEVWPSFRTFWNQHAHVCSLSWKWTVEAPSFWSGKDQLRACSPSRSSHPSSGSGCTTWRMKAVRLPWTRAAFLQQSCWWSGYRLNRLTLARMANRTSAPAFIWTISGRGRVTLCPWNQFKCSIFSREHLSEGFF